VGDEQPTVLLASGIEARSAGRLDRGGIHTDDVIADDLHGQIGIIYGAIGGTERANVREVSAAFGVGRNGDGEGIGHDFLAPFLGEEKESFGFVSVVVPGMYTGPPMV